jgi:cyanophycinase
MRICIAAIHARLPGILLTFLLSSPLLAAPVAATAPSAHNYRDHNFDYFVRGDPSRSSAEHTSFTLALMGGGGSVDAAFAALARAAGHGHIVILRAVADDSYDPTDGDYGESFVTKWGPVASAETLVFRNRAAAYEEAVLAVLRRADGIFIAGGDQANYIHYWKGTPVQEALNHHVQLNRPIGGSSAGLAVLGHYSYTALDGGSLESKVALADPGSPALTLEDDFLHFRWLEHVITDSHFSARSRLGRSLVFLAKIEQAYGDRAVVGLGIDERTALLIDAHGNARLASGSAGSAWLLAEPQPASPFKAGRGLSLPQALVTRLGSRSTFSLATGEISKAVEATTFSIDNGVAQTNSAVRAILYRDVVPPDEP